MGGEQKEGDNCTMIRIKKNMIFQIIRERIYTYVKDNPGSHLRKISKDLAIGMGDVQYHLTNLEKFSLIKIS